MNRENEDLIEKYSEDISTIKGLLLQVDETPMVESWAFFIWGAMVLLSTVLHYFAATAWKLTLAAIFTEIWLPAMLVAILVESLALLKKLGKRHIPIFSRNTVNMYLAVTGMFIVFCFIIIGIISRGNHALLPSFLLTMLSMFFLVYAQNTYYNFMYPFAYALILAGILLYIFEISLLPGMMITGILYGTACLVIGIIAHRKERTANGKE